MKLKKLMLCFLAAVFSLSAVAPTTRAAEPVPISEPSQYIIPQEAAAFTPEASSFTSHTVTLPAGSKTAVYQINMEHAGYLFIPLSITGTEKGVTVQLFSDAACTAKVGSSRFLNSNNLTDTLKAPIPKAATYYLQLSAYSGMSVDTVITINPYCYNGENREIADKEEVYSYSGTNNIIYHKINIPKTGYIKVEASSNSSTASLYVSLFDSGKTELSDSVYLSSSINKGVTYFAVKKGTYYLGTKTYDIAHLKYSFSPVSEKSGSSKKKAVSIGKGKTVKGVILASDSADKYDYYKVKLTKKQVLSLTLNAKSCGQLNFKIIPANSKTIVLHNTIPISNNTKQTVKSTDKFAAGTYYIQVSKTKAGVSGYYTIKFNK